jgi:hypothetical protein
MRFFPAVILGRAQRDPRTQKAEAPSTCGFSGLRFAQPENDSPREAARL